VAGSLLIVVAAAFVAWRLSRAVGGYHLWLVLVAVVAVFLGNDAQILVAAAVLVPLLATGFLARLVKARADRRPTPTGAPAAGRPRRPLPGGA
jgi:hypothetical protein